MEQEVLKSWDRFINWEKRLHYEVPFFKDIFSNNETRRVLDACCGSGRHAIEFAKMGMEVIGIDSSEKILEDARENSEKAGLDITFHKGDILDLSGFSEEEFDGIICVGNSLALVESFQNVEIVIENFTRILRKNGILVIHLVDLNKLKETGQFMLPVVSGIMDEHERLLCRIFHVSDDASSYVTFVLIEKKSGKWEGKAYRQNLVRIRYGEMRGVFRRLDYQKVEFFSSFKKHPLDDKNFTGMIVVAKK